MIEIKSTSSLQWVDCVLENFNDFLRDHAACERKASATGLNLALKYSEHSKLVDCMLSLAREELQHYHQVVRLLIQRKESIRCDEKDPYVNRLLKHVRTGKREHFLDRLLVFGLVERRGHERFSLVAKYLKDDQLKPFYSRLSQAEERHFEIFETLAFEYFDSEEVTQRAKELNYLEAEILDTSKIRPAVH